MNEDFTAAHECIVACSAPYGTGGLGQHLALVVEMARATGSLAHYFSSGIKQGDDKGRVVRVPATRWINHYTPVRFSPGWKNYIDGDLHDRVVAARLERARQLSGFGGQALHSFQQARRLGYESLELEAANSHVDNVMRQHALAIRRFGLERSWLNDAQQRKTLREYALADVIYVASEYTRQSFLDHGVPARKLHLRALHPAPRFTTAHRQPHDGTFRVVYVGSLTVMKGIPVLLEAFARLAGRDAELVLVGGWTTRAMRRYLQEWMRRDQRIRIAPGDPLPPLQQADVYVHPTFEDGFAYAPCEALALGVPVIVTADTGMKERIQEGVTGYVIPTGDTEALFERLDAMKRAGRHEARVA